ncbi:MAG: hypothetical protein IPH20_04275 [Bacteroidales bacterium]|nr:hypothetical protein [Bacteroidales bacterium]
MDGLASQNKSSKVQSQVRVQGSVGSWHWLGKKVQKSKLFSSGSRVKELKGSKVQEFPAEKAGLRFASQGFKSFKVSEFQGYSVTGFPD